MKTATLARIAAVLLLATSGASLAQAHASAQNSPSCTPAGDCTRYKHVWNVPANALSQSGLTASARGLDWPSNNGNVTLTMRRPPDFNGSKVRLTLVYETLGFNTGDNAFSVTAIAFHHGSGFETYGGFLGDSLDIGPDALLQQSVTVESGEGWDPEGPWWYFEIGRHGSYNGGLRLMALTVEY